MWKRMHALILSLQWQHVTAIKSLFLFSLHKKFSRSFVKLQLNPWCHYFTDVLATFLDLDRGSSLAVYEELKGLGFHIKYLNLCSKYELMSYGLGSIKLTNMTFSLWNYLYLLLFCYLATSVMLSLWNWPKPPLTSAVWQRNYFANNKMFPYVLTTYCNNICVEYQGPNNWQIKIRSKHGWNMRSRIPQDNSRKS